MNVKSICASSWAFAALRADGRVPAFVGKRASYLKAKKPKSGGLQPKSDGLQPTSDGLQPSK